MEKFDIKRFLGDEGIEFWEKGKNIMKNFVGAKCWSCGDDPSCHLNLRVDGWFALCFRCGVKVKGIKDVVEFVLGRDVGQKEFLRLMKKYGWIDESVVGLEGRKNGGHKSNIEEEWNRFTGLRKVDIEYLKSRGIGEDFARRWGLRGGIEQYLYYVMVPVRDESGQLVGFVGRDTTGKSEKKFLNSMTDLRSYLFGLFECRDKMREDGYVIIVEGVFDVLKLQQYGVNAVGVLGKVMSDNQLKQLLKVVRSNVVVYVMLDSDATREARELGEVLSSYFKMVKVCTVTGVKDAGDLREEEIVELKKFFEENVVCGTTFCHGGSVKSV